MKKLPWLLAVLLTALVGVGTAVAQDAETPSPLVAPDAVASVDVADSIRIVAPVDGAEFQAGSTLDLRADLPATASLRWDVVVVSDAGTEAIATAVEARSPSVELPATGTVLAPDAVVVVTATALYPDGGSSVDRVTLVPESVQMSFRTIPSGFPMIFDGEVRVTPFTVDTVVGANHAVEPLASQCDGENSWVFQLWFNGSWAGKVIEVPTFDTTLTAKYGLATSCDDTADPIGLVTSPVADAEIDMPLVVEGLAVDNHSVGAVRVAIRDVEHDLWWSGVSWEPNWRWLDTRLSSPLARSTTWQYRFDAGDDPGSGSYAISAWTLDSSNNVYNADPATQVFLAAEVDSTAPTGEIVSPAVGERSERPILAFGTAADPSGIARVGLEIVDVTADTWWDGVDWVAEPTQVDAVLADPGGTETSWTYYFDSPLGSGSYTLQAIAVDAVGNAAPLDAAPRPFFTDEPGVYAEATLTLPEDGGTADSPTILAGTASDDTGVASVSLGIQDLATGEWWFGDGFGNAFRLVDAALVNPGEAETNWLYAFDPDAAGGSGSYRVDVWVRDVDGLLTTPVGLGSSFTTPAADDGGAGPGDGTDPGSGDGSDPGSGDGSDPGAGDGSDPGSGDGSDPGAGDGSDPGSGDGSDPGAGDGSDPGSGDGSDPGAGDGSDPGSGDGTDPGAGDGSDPGSGDGTDPGAGGGSDRGIGRMLISTVSDRREPVELEGATASGISYMFFELYDETIDVARVTFWLDDPSMNGAPSRVEAWWPYDFGGGGPFGRNASGPTEAWDYDTARLADGLHTITARVDLGDGTFEVVDTTFTIDNGGVAIRTVEAPVAEAAPMIWLRSVIDLLR